MVMVKSQRGGISLGVNEETFDKLGVDLLLLRNSTKLFFKQVETEITKGKKMQTFLRVVLDAMKPVF
jgi:hypothetical protein